MAKEKKIVKVEKTEKSGSYGLDENRRIVKVESKGDSKKRAKTKRILAIVLWLLAITCEVFGILRLTDKITWLDKVPFVIGAIVLDLAFFIPGSLLWKKANHIDPISEKNKVGFWCWNNLGTLLSVLAFLPIIIFVLTNKDLDKKDKTIVTAVAAVALLVAGISSYDFNPVSSEQLEKAQKEVIAEVGVDKVYWAPTGKKYHVDPDCPAFSQSETVYEGTVADAYERGLTDPCRRCIHELEEDHDHNEDE
jgi:4-amino-4-deoxy-L-arabinose transferase-like glycosyltransferase